MGRKRKYSPKDFKQAVDKYFRSITFVKPVCDEGGKPIRDLDGNEIKLLEFADAPSLGALRRKLGISADTWAEYSRLDGYCEVCADARERIECWLERELVTRCKGVEGIKFNLANNYGWNSESRKRIELSHADGTASGSEKEKQLSMDEKIAVISEVVGELGIVDELGVNENSSGDGS